MSNNDINSEVEQLKAWAEQRLENHLMELNTRYGGENVETKELLEEAFEAHRVIFERELQEKIGALGGTNDPWVTNELEQIKKEYLARLQQQEN